MSRVLVNLEIIIDPENLLLSEIETAMHKMLTSIGPDINVEDYGLDVDYLD